MSAAIKNAYRRSLTAGVLHTLGSWVRGSWIRACWAAPPRQPDLLAGSVLVRQWGRLEARVGRLTRGRRFAALEAAAGEVRREPLRFFCAFGVFFLAGNLAVSLFRDIAPTGLLLRAAALGAFLGGLFLNPDWDRCRAGSRLLKRAGDAMR